MDRMTLYLRAEKFSHAVADFARPLTSYPDAVDAARQLLDSSSAIAANYLTAGDARSRKEFGARMGVVVEEADETVHWLRYLVRHPRCQLETIAPLLDEGQQLARIFGKAYGTVRRNLGAAAPPARRSRRTPRRPSRRRRRLPPGK